MVSILRSSEIKLPVVTGNTQRDDRRPQVFTLQLPVVRSYVNIMARNGTGDRTITCKWKILMINSRLFTSSMTNTDAKKTAGVSRHNRMTSQTQLIQVHFHLSLCRTGYEPALQFALRSNMTDGAITRI